MPPISGLIPTYAGNTNIGVQNLNHCWAHPHVCGEHALLLAVAGAAKGSSPRMRGTLGGCARDYRRAGLIPTYAGNTWYAGRGAAA